VLADLRAECVVITAAARRRHRGRERLHARQCAARARVAIAIRVEHRMNHRSRHARFTGVDEQRPRAERVADGRGEGDLFHPYAVGEGEQQCAAVRRGVVILETARDGGVAPPR
jgi:hypothetical protein